MVNHINNINNINNINKRIITVLLSITMIFLVSAVPTSVKAAASNYTITTKSTSLDSSYTRWGGYNKYTKDYYIFRSYLEKLEKTGGTLTVKKGTYSITNTLYVPNNVKIVFEDGVVIKKGTVTGLSSMPPSASVFQLITPSKSEKSGVYGGYNGQKNISFTGKGKVTFDMSFSKDCVGIILGHNDGVTIKNIDFINMYSGHFIELNSSKKVLVQDCSFSGSKASPNRNKEAINIDSADKLTKGYNQKWSKFDKTSCSDVTIKNNNFNNLDRAIGTHKYSQNKPHKNIVIDNNTITNTRQDSIRAMNWLNPIIENNTITKAGTGMNDKYRGILASGTINPTFKNNIFNDVGRSIQFIVWENTGDDSNYPPIYDEISDQNIEDLKTNKATNVTENFIRINTILNEYSAGTKKVYLY